MKKLTLYLLLCQVSFAAIGATAVWDIQQAAAASNANGCFYTSGGTDYSKGTSVHATITTLSVVNATTTKLTVSLTDYTVASGDIGNGFHDTGGTLTQGWYEIISVDTMLNTWTVDRALGTAAQTGTGKMGGSCSSLGTTAITPSTGNKVYIKCDATYSISTGWTFNTSNDNILVQGYNATQGDQGC